MSSSLIEYTICDICGDSDIEARRHYKISCEEYSTINCRYFEPRTIHICKSHEAEEIPYDKLFFAPKTKPNKE